MIYNDLVVYCFTILDRFIDFSRWITYYMLATHFTVELTTGYIDRTGLKDKKKVEEKTEEQLILERKRRKAGLIVSRCENILILTFMHLNEVTALVIIIGIKGLVRREDIEKKPGYYLVGTILNLTISILLGLLIKVLIMKYGNLPLHLSKA